MKKIVTFIISAALLLGALQPVSAATLPRAFWAMADSLAAAKDAGDDDGIIAAAKQICELLEGTQKDFGIKEILATRYSEIAEAYERKGDFAAASEYFNIYLPYAREVDWKDGVKIAEAKVKIYEPFLQTYLEIDQNPVYFGAKNEPVSGVLYGKASAQADAGESMILLYEEFGNPLGGMNKNRMEEAISSSRAVEFALNFPQEGTTAAAVPSQGAYIESFLQELAPYARRTPIFLRIGAEMDVWSNPATPEVFITAYRTIADAARRIAPELALVWSVNFVSGWYTNAQDYYPGDEYVDWVGISLYPARYYANTIVDKNDRINEIMFKAGRGADPAYMVKDIIEKFGDRKPIMISEGGVSHKNAVLGLDSTEWAVNRLREYYGGLPMVYPQIKLMAYFDRYSNGAANNYALNQNSTLDRVYDELTQQPAFIQAPNSSAGGYVKLDGQGVRGGFTIASYAHYYEQDNIKVEYYVDDQFVASSDTAPYRVQIGALSLGNHLVKTVAYSADGRKLGESLAGVVAEDKITIIYNGTELIGDVPASIIDGRTMVPLRLIFDAMGASVDWEADTRTITSVLGDTTVVMQVGNKIMSKNNENKELDVPPIIVDSRTLVPVRAVAEAFGARVGWEPDTRTVKIDF